MSGNLSKLIRGQLLGHVIILSQSETSIQVMWLLSADQRPVTTRDHPQPIRGQYPGQVITLDQSEAIIQLSRSRDHFQPIRGQMLTQDPGLGKWCLEAASSLCLWKKTWIYYSKTKYVQYHNWVAHDWYYLEKISLCPGQKTAQYSGLV